MIDELKENLKILSLKVKHQIFKNLQGNNLPKRRYRVYNNVKYDYTDRKGIKQCQCYWDSTKRIYKFDILNVTHMILNLIKDEEVYKTSLKKLYFFIENNGVSKEDISVYTNNALYSFINKLNKCILSEIEFTNESHLNNLNLQFDEKDIEKLINGFIDELMGKSAYTKLEIELSGIVLNFNRFVTDNLELRRPNKNDLRKLFLRDPHLEYLGIAEMPTCPSAIMCITFPEDNTTYEPTIEISHFTKIIIRLLTLFKIGDIKCLNFKVETYSILKSDAYRMYHNVNNILNYINSSLDLYFPIYLGDGHKQKKYTLTLPFARHLNDFINMIGTEIYNLSPKKGHLYINIAYGHYLNALMQHDSIMEGFYVEKRITEAIMGLESLYKKEKSERSYTVRKRISKVFDVLVKYEPIRYRELLKNNYDPIKVRKRIEEAYKIRNAFAHGDRPNPDQLEEIEIHLKEIDDEYTGLNDLLTHLIDYLRISIILLLFNEKNKFIDLIDAALINCKNDELDKAFSKTKSLILLNNIDL